MKNIFAIFAVLLLAAFATAQDPARATESTKSSQPAAHDNYSMRIFVLKSLKSPNEMQEVQNAVRSVTDIGHITTSASQNAIVLRGTPEQLAMAEKIITDLDKPPVQRETYRLDYTITEMEGDRKVNSRTYTLMCEDASKCVLKLGSRVPVNTGSPAPGGSSAPFTYLDVGLNINAHVWSRINGELTVASSVEMSSVADATAPGQAAPVIRQLNADDESAVTPGKPIVISTADDVGSHRQFQVQLVATKVK